MRIGFRRKAYTTSEETKKYKNFYRLPLENDKTNIHKEHMLLFLSFWDIRCYLCRRLCLLSEYLVENFFLHTVHR